MKRIILVFIVAFSFIGCNKEGKKHPCYDPSIVHNGACTADCPGFEGCDGKIYCNACEAARQGIGPK